MLIITLQRLSCCSSFGGGIFEKERLVMDLGNLLNYWNASKDVQFIQCSTNVLKFHITALFSPTVVTEGAVSTQ